jgi:phosphatidate cytidylyltransferase
MLKYRILTAIIALPLVIWGVLSLQPLAFEIIMGAVMLLGAWEWTQFIKLNNVLLRTLYVAVIMIALYGVLYVSPFIVLGMGLFIWLWSLVVVYRFNQVSNQKSIMGAEYTVVRAAFGFCFLISTWLAMHVLRLPLLGGPHWLLFAFIVVWITDTGAYFVGRRWGQHKLAVNVSPNKTWEGVWGGLVFGLLSAVILSFCVAMPWSQRFAYWALSVVVIIFSIVGDLTISVFKRQNKLKDSGKLFPGHGGILDRLDSIAPAVVMYALGLLLLMK